MTYTASKKLFSRARRLDGPQAYAAVFAFKCWVTGELFRVYASPNGLATARLGVVVSKRVIPGAVARNYCKRVAREVFRALGESLGGVDVVVRPRTVVTPAMSAAAHAEIRDLLQRAQDQCRRRVVMRSP